MLITKKEYSNFISHTFKNFRQIPGVISFFLNIGLIKVKAKFKTHKTINYPTRALGLVKLVEAYSFKDYTEIAYDDEIGMPFVFITSLVSYKADVNFKWSHFKNILSDDQEVIISINRWYWLIYEQKLADEISAETIYKIVKHWIKCNPYTETVVWESYSSSERISSIVIALLLKQDISLIKEQVNNDEQLASFFKQSIYVLSTHLEYYPDGITFNHVLNDLKGIATAAVIIGDDLVLHAAMNLIWQELSILIDQDGFLREGSSHYQLIVTRWLCELEFILLKDNQTQYFNKLHSYTQAMINKVMFFKIDTGQYPDKLPLIGDISPDFDPQWLLNYFSAIAPFQEGKIKTGYGACILEQIGFFNSEQAFNDDVYSYNEYTRINKGNWVLFTKHTCNAGAFYPSHAHEDYGSYVMFYHGKEIITDPGRENYKLPPSSDTYCMPAAHNAMMLDGLPVSLSVNHYYLAPVYKTANYKKQILNENSYVTLTLQTDSVNRIAGGKFKRYSRTFLVNDDEILITDNIEGTGVAQVSSTITLDKDIDLEMNNSDSYLLQIDKHRNIKIRLESGGVMVAASKGYTCNRYGNADITSLIHLQGDGNVCSIRYSLAGL